MVQTISLYNRGKLRFFFKIRGQMRLNQLFCKRVPEIRGQFNLLEGF